MFLGHCVSLERNELQGKSLLSAESMHHAFCILSCSGEREEEERDVGRERERDCIHFGSDHRAFPGELSVCWFQNGRRMGDSFVNMTVTCQPQSLRFWEER